MINNVHSFFATVQDCHGLSVHVRQQNDTTVTLVDLDDVGTALEEEKTEKTKEFLAPAEQIYFKRFKYMKRRKEWLGGRITAKAALRIFAQLTAYEAQQLTILPDAYGRPTVEGLTGSQTDFSISISHSGQYAVTLAAPGKACGIDLQKISPKLAALTDHFSTDQELALLARQSRAETPDTWLTMLWSVKETMKKRMLHDQSVIFSDTEAERITRIRQHVYRFSCTVQGRPRSALVYALPPYILSMSPTETDHA